MSKLKTTGKPRQFDTGAQRDNADGKPRMSLVPHKALYAVMERYLVGADEADARAQAEREGIDIKSIHKLEFTPGRH
jgi:hypothetical protein